MYHTVPDRQDLSGEFGILFSPPGTDRNQYADIWTSKYTSVRHFPFHAAGYLGEERRWISGIIEEKVRTCNLRQHVAAELFNRLRNPMSRKTLLDEAREFHEDVPVSAPPGVLQRAHT